MADLKYDYEDFTQYFDAHYPRASFETQAVYDNYKRDAWTWYCLGYNKCRADSAFNIPFEKN